MRHLLVATGLLLASLALLGCRPPAGPSAPPEEGPVWFEDVTERLGLDFTHDVGPTPDNYFMPHLIGSGAALFDFDGDGRLDLYLLQNGGPAGKKNRLFRQRPDGTFQDVSTGSGLDVAGHGMGVTAGDVNNDGRPDLVVTEYGRIRLFLNEGGGRFRDATEEAGLKSPLWGTSAALLDFDRDGWLDLVVVNYLAYDPTWPCTNVNGQRDFCAPKTFQGTTAKLFRNLGREPPRSPTPPGAGKGGVRFKDVSFESGLALRPGPGLGVVCADFTGDRWPDIFVANDGSANHLWVNQKDGTFKEEAVLRACGLNAMGKAEANMGIAWGDVDGDGLQDLFVTHLNVETNTVWRQVTPGQFQDWTVPSRMHRPAWRATGFGTVLADFDNDGALDAAVANGAVVRQEPRPGSRLGPFWSRYGERNQLFQNDGTGRFRDLSPHNPALCGHDNVGRGLAVGDLDNTGALCLVVTAAGDRVRVYRNVAPNRGHWLGVRAQLAGGRDALGALVTVRAGGKAQVRTVHAGGSFLCSNDPRAHFGLGAAARFDGAEVTWPDGSREAFPGGAADRHVTLAQGQGRALP